MTISPTRRGVLIVVSDEGPGIPPSQQGALFQRFSRLEPSTARGTGLGLYIVAHMVEAMGGWVVCCSDVGFGTHFGVVLPRPVDAAPRADASVPAPALVR